VNPVDIFCNLCGKRDFKVVEDDESPFQVLKCRRCGLVFVDPLPEPAVLAAHYDDNYYAEWMNSQKELRLRMWRKRLGNLEKYRQIGRILDVGCADGIFLKLAKKNGWEILGIDIFCGDLFDAGYPDHSFDVVTLWHVLEHVIDPKRYFYEIHRILKPSGLLVVAVPNVNDWVMRVAYRIFKLRPLKLFSKNDREIHLYHFSPRTITAYLDKAGFRRLKLSPDYGIIQYSKKIVNFIAVAISNLTGLKLFNAFEVYALKEELGVAKTMQK
jgi:2-polyprenyl-3-methyl-5-hydroxy-6-metoxy-1,4-benzoquinol methylase